jgi:hypothetical protein
VGLQVPPVEWRALTSVATSPKGGSWLDT